MRQLGRGRRVKPILTSGSVAPGLLFETVTDDFTDGSIDTAKWQNYGTTSETGGRARVTVDTGFSAFQLFPIYTIVGSYVLLRIDTWPAASTATTATIELIVDSDQVAAGTRLVIAADVVTGQLTASNQVGFVDGGSVSTGFSTAAPLWLRIDGRTPGSLNFEYSLTGNPSSWTNIRTIGTIPDWLTTAGQKAIVQGHRDAGVSDFFEFDDFNLPTADPPTPSPIVKQGPQFRFPGKTVYAPKGFHRGEESPQPRVYLPFSGRKPFPLPPGGVFRKGPDRRPPPSSTTAVAVDGGSRPIPLAVRLTSAQGDVLLVSDIRNLNFRSVVPGGFATMTVTIDRKIAESQPEIQQFGRAYLYDTRSGDTVWEGQVEDPGKGVSANGETWTITVVGPSAHASDDTFNYLPIDRTVDHFEKFGASTKSGNVSTFTDDDDNDGVKVQFGGGIAVASPQYVAGRSQRVYNASTTLGSVRATVVGGGTGQWDMVMYVYGSGGSDLIDSVALTTTPQSFYGEVGSEFSSDGTTTHLRMNRTGASTTPDDNAYTFFYDIVIRTVMRDEEGTLLTDYSADYITASQIVQDLIGSHTTLYDGLDAYIEVTTNQIKQFAYDATTVRDALNDLLVLEGAYYWAAWETVPRSGLWRFEFRPWPTTVRYEASVDDSFNQPGSAAELYNKANVHWYDAVKRVHVETRTSTVTTLDNAGRTRAADLELGSELGSLSAAQSAGDNFLAEHNLPIRNGRLIISRPIMDFDRGMMVDPWMIRPGGLIRLRSVNPERNALNPTGRDGSTIFRITAVNYRISDNSAELELDTDALSTSQALAKLARKRPRK